MKTNSTKYILCVDSRIEEGVSTETKHQLTMDFLHQIPGDWGIDKGFEYPVPKFGNDITAFFRLTKKLGKEIKGDIMYGYRRLIRDHHSCDDRIWIEFKAQKVSFNELITSILKKYIIGFRAYKLCLYPQDLIYVDKGIPQAVNNKINYRKCIDFFYPFHYMDSNLIMNLFGFGKIELLKRLQAANIDAEEVNDGVFFKLTDSIIGVEQALDFNRAVQQALNVSLPIIKE